MSEVCSKCKKDIKFGGSVLEDVYYLHKVGFLCKDCYLVEKVD